MEYFKTNLPAISSGTILNERYEIGELIGTGGYGRVYRAKDKKLKKKIRAIKEIYITDINTKKLMLSKENFLKEASILCTLNHPGIPEVMDYFCNDHNYYIVMEYIEGITLDEKYKKEKRLWSEKEIISFALEICNILEYLHSRSIVFRDIKPQNIMMDKDRAKLIDFGIARHFRPGQTKDTINIGTPGYAAPEQYGKSGGSDERTDIYSLGVILHYLASGEDPQEKEETFKFSLIKEKNPEISEAMENIINKCINLNKSERFQNIRELKGILSDLKGAIAEKNTLVKKEALPEFFKKEFAPNPPPKDSKIILERTGEKEILIDIPGKFSFTLAAKVLALSLWLWIWSFGLTMVFKHFPLSLNCFSLFWYAGGIIAIIFGISNIIKILTSMFGRTGLTFEENHLKLKTRWLGLISREKLFSMSSIENFSFEYNQNIRGLKALYDIPGKVYFQYGKKRINLPVNIKQKENNWLCEEIGRIFDFFSP